MPTGLGVGALVGRGFKSGIDFGVGVIDGDDVGEEVACSFVGPSVMSVGLGVGSSVAVGAGSGVSSSHHFIMDEDAVGEEVTTSFVGGSILPDRLGVCSSAGPMHGSRRR